MEFKLNSTSIGYWGEPSSTIDWCEDNYALSFYIAEFWNTISNVLFVVLAIYGYRRARREGFEPRFLYQYIAVIIVGIGSASFHGTLRYVCVKSKLFISKPLSHSFILASSSVTKRQ